MQLKVNAEIGQKVSDLLHARYAERYPEAKLVSPRIKSMRDIIEERFSGRLQIFFLHEDADFTDVAVMVALRAMKRSFAVHKTTHHKAGWTVLDVQQTLLAAGLRSVSVGGNKIQNVPLYKELAELYDLPGATGNDLGALGETLYQLCNMRIIDMGVPRQRRPKLQRELRAIARNCDRAQTLVDQRNHANQLLQCLRRGLKAYATRDVLVAETNVMWDFITQILLDGPSLWRRIV